MIKKIAHISDVHVRKSPSRNEEYYSVFNELYKSLNTKKPDIIVLTGDIVNDYIDLQGEQIILLGDFFNNLVKIAPVRVIRGNHDYQSKNKNRIDAVEAVLKNINNPNIVYYNETGFYDDNNVTWAVWKHGDKKISPWKLKTKTYNKENTVIDLFHNTVNGSVNIFGFEFNSPTNVNIRDLKGEYTFMGHIHKQQYVDKDKKKAYAGSLLAQKFDEGDDNFHGYILWNIENGSSELIPIKNEYSFKNVTVNDFTDFDDLDIEIDDVTKYMRIRVIWETLPYIKTPENESKIVSHLREKYKGVLNISHTEKFLEDKKISKIDDEVLNDINDVQVQHNIFREYFEKMGVDDDIVEEILELDTLISSRINPDEMTNIQWDIVRSGGENFMSYEKFDIDWHDKSGIIQVSGGNALGKTTIFKNILYTLFNKTPETENRIKFGDYRYVNNRNGATFCNGFVVLNANSEFYGVKRETTIKKNKAGEINGAPTTVKYYKLNNYDDELTDDNCIENLNEGDKNKTQKTIERIIGDYDNFMRVVFTTSDTLNGVLSNDMAVFIDSLLYDSGLDVFDKKLTEYKSYIKEIQNNKPRVVCNVESTKENINQYNKRIEEEKIIIENYNKELVEIKNNIKKGNQFVDEFRGKLHEIDNEIYNLNVNQIENNNIGYNQSIKDYEAQKQREEAKLVGLAETFNEEKYNNLNNDIDNFKSQINEIKIKKTELNGNIQNISHKNELLRGEIYKLKINGKNKKEEFLNFKNSPTCPTCKQKIVGDDHKDILDDILGSLKNEINNIAEDIKKIETVDIPANDSEIFKIQEEVRVLDEKIITLNLDMEKTLSELGVLINHRNDVAKRKEILSVIEKIPLQIEILQSKINEGNNLIKRFNDNLKLIEDNKKNKQIIEKGRLRLEELNEKLLAKNNQISTCENNILIIENKIKELNIQIEDFLIQKRTDEIYELYEKCIHRKGIPVQILSNYIIPKINKELDNQLQDMLFKVWLDETDLRPKLTYKNNSNSTIDAISSSGKERTFASIALKQALVSINKKSKPRLFLLDEVTGKLLNESVQEFIDLIYSIKKRVNKLVIVEHTHDIEPDYVLDVEKDENDISTVTLR